MLSARLGGWDAPHMLSAQAKTAEEAPHVLCARSDGLDASNKPTAYVERGQEGPLETSARSGGLEAPHMGRIRARSIERAPPLSYMCRF